MDKPQYGGEMVDVYIIWNNWDDCQVGCGQYWQEWEAVADMYRMEDAFAKKPLLERFLNGFLFRWISHRLEVRTFKAEKLTAEQLKDLGYDD